MDATRRLKASFSKTFLEAVAVADDDGMGEADDVDASVDGGEDDDDGFCSDAISLTEVPALISASGIGDTRTLLFSANGASRGCGLGPEKQHYL